jgi:hypothetical protein
MTMNLHVEGARPEELERGLAAARAVFEAADVPPFYEDSKVKHLKVVG